MSVLSPQLASLHSFLGAEPVTSNEDLFSPWCLKPVIIQDEVSPLSSHPSFACAQNACAFKNQLGKHCSEVLFLPKEQLWRQRNWMQCLCTPTVCACVYVLIHAHICTYAYRQGIHYIVCSNIYRICKFSWCVSCTSKKEVTNK